MRASAPSATRRRAPFIKSPDLHAPSPLPPGLFNNIAPRYDLVNLGLSGGFVLLWDRALRQAVARAGAENRDGTSLLLDLGCGTLRFTRGLLRQLPGLHAVVVDPSPPMLKQGLARLPLAARKQILLVQGLAESLPLADNSLNMAVSQFVWRNVNSRTQALTEIRRALKPGGYVFILEFGSGKERIWGGLYNFYLRNILPRLADVLSGRPGEYAYLAQSILGFPPPQDIAGEIRAAGFIDVTWARLTSGIVHLYTGRKS